MLNEERILLMTRMASYEANEGKKYKRLGTWFRGDYLSSQILKALLSATIVFVLLLALYIFYNLEDFMEYLYDMDYLITFAKSVLKWYLVTVAGYAVVCYAACTVRYVRARKSLRLYYQSLKKLNTLYQEEYPKG